MLNRLNKLPSHARITPRDYNKLIDRINALSTVRAGRNMSIRASPGGLSFNARGGRGGGTARQFATIARTLRRGDPAANPPVEARNYYGILLSEAQAWKAGIKYSKDDICTYEDELYECTNPHTSKPDFPPPVSNNWQVSDGVPAYVHGYYDDLLQSAPWFQEGDTVEVYQRSGTWYIDETVTRIESSGSDGFPVYSLHWNKSQKRLMAVFG